MTEAALFGVDTNVLVYADGLNDEAKRVIAVATLEGLGRGRIVLPTQVVGEFYNVLSRKHGISAKQAAARTAIVAGNYTLAASTPHIFIGALDLASTHQLQFWDALILATAAEAGCRLLLTEDMPDGFVWRGCTVANPFAESVHPLLKDALERR